MKYQDLKSEDRTPSEWITESMTKLIQTDNEQEETSEEDHRDTVEEEKQQQEEVRNKREISLDTTPEDYEEGFKKWSEMTATSPSGRHLGLYKALLKNEELSAFFSECASY